MRVIDADALLQRAIPHGWSTPLWVSDIMIKDAPTIDAEPVVHCKDCKHYTLHCTWNGEKRYWCELQILYGGVNGFCSCGAKMDEVNDEVKDT